MKSILKGILTLICIIGSISSFVLFVVSISENDGKLGIIMLVTFFITSILCLESFLSIKNEW